jgi:thioredoxin 1
MKLADLLKSHDRPVVVQFHASWCGPCKALSPKVTAMETEFAGRVDVVRVDVDQDEELAREVHVRGVPTLVAYQGGAEIRRQVGGMDAAGLRTFFQISLGEVSATKSVANPAWILAAKFVGAFALLTISSQVPSVEWLRWPGLGILFWAMRDFCPSCRTAGAS